MSQRVEYYGANDIKILRANTSALKTHDINCPSLKEQQKALVEAQLLFDSLLQQHFG